jgi:hypothetical protein
VPAEPSLLLVSLISESTNMSVQLDTNTTSSAPSSAIFVDRANLQAQEERERETTSDVDVSQFFVFGQVLTQLREHFLLDRVGNQR